MSSVVPRVYVLGKSPLTGLVTHALAKLPSQPQVPEIVSLLPSEDQLRSFLNHNSTVKLTQYSTYEKFASSTTQLMSACRPPVYNDGSYAPINELVVSLSNPKDISGLLTYKPCLKPYSNILLLNSDRSILDAISKDVWKDPLERPNIYQCISTFTTWKESIFETSVLDREGTLKIARAPRFVEDIEDFNVNLSDNVNESGDLIKMISKTDILNPLFMTYTDFALEQNEFMIAKTCIGSLTSLYGCDNGQLLKMSNISNVLVSLINELIKIINRTDQLLVKNTPYSTISLDANRLLTIILNVLSKTQHDTTLMRKQFNLWDLSEINSSLTYFTQLAKKNRVSAPNLIFLRNLVLSKISLKDLRTLKDPKYEDIDDIELEM